MIPSSLPSPSSDSIPAPIPSTPIIPTHEDALGPVLAEALRARGYDTLTPVQIAALDDELRGRDLRVSSQTGSGKTLAIGFLIRDLVSADGQGREGPSALVVVPTRELARQVEGELAWLFEKTKVTLAVVTGGSNAYLERRALGKKPTIVVGTPGRLLDHLRGGALSAASIATVVLDEADRMLDLGFREDLEEIFNQVPEGRRTILVSATFPADVKRLADRVQKAPVSVEGTKLGAANEDIAHVVHLVPEDRKVDAIVNLLLLEQSARTLIFARTRADVGGLTKALRDAGFPVDSLSGDMEQPARLRALAAFKEGRLTALVATDVAARGIDVVDVSRVIQVDLPQDPDTYTHRSGRTGRAGRKGESVVLVSPMAFRRTMSLLRAARAQPEVLPVPTARSIREAEEARLVLALTGDAVPEGLTIDERAKRIAARLIEQGPLDRVIERLVGRLIDQNGPPAREIPVLTPPRDPRADARSDTRSDTRSPVGERRPQRDFHATERTFVPFRVSYGREHGADPRRLLAIVCRRGGIEGSDVGAITIARVHSVIGIASGVADAFAKASETPDERNPKIKIRPEVNVEAPREPQQPHVPRIRPSRPSLAAPDRPSRPRAEPSAPSPSPPKAARSRPAPPSKEEPAHARAAGKWTPKHAPAGAPVRGKGLEVAPERPNRRKIVR